MTASVSYTVTGQIGNIVIDSPPVNALSRAVRQGIIECLKVAEADDTEVVVLRCEGRTFIAGADITEFTELFGAGADDAPPEEASGPPGG